MENPSSASPKVNTTKRGINYMEQQLKACYTVSVYRADGLPVMCKQSKTKAKQLNPFIQVMFAGHKGKSSVKTGSFSPVWNEEIKFVAIFPATCDSFEIRLMDSSSKEEVIGAHSIKLADISHEGDEGFLPTFGPSFIYMYGALKDQSDADGQHPGKGEGLAYRGRVLLAIRTELFDEAPKLTSARASVTVEPVNLINEEKYGKSEEYIFFSTIYEVSMINSKLGKKDIYFEMSLGNAGDTMDCLPSDRPDESQGPTYLTPQGVNVTESWLTTTPVMKSLTYDKVYFYLPIWDDKPCLHLKDSWPDVRRRMYNSNMITKIADQFERELGDLKVLSQRDRSDGQPEIKLKAALDNLCSACENYVAAAKKDVPENTTLEKNRVGLCITTMNQIEKTVKHLKPVVKQQSLAQSIDASKSMLLKLRSLEEDVRNFLFTACQSFWKYFYNHSNMY